MPDLNIDVPVHALQVILTGTERGWNWAVLHDGKPLQNDGPADTSSAEEAMSRAVEAIRAQWSPET